MSYEKQWGTKEFKILSETGYCVQKIKNLVFNKFLCDDDYCSDND